MQTFKEQQKLFYQPYGWVIYLKQNIQNNEYSDVLIDAIETKKGLQGKLTQVPTALLSFTEYTLQGFTQERLVELPEIGEWAYFWYNGTGTALYAKYGGINGELYIALLANGNYPYQNVSKTPPKL